MVAQEIWRTLDVVRGEGVATVVVDKNIFSLSRIADRLLVLSKGCIVFAGALGARQRIPKVLERYVGI
jgi:branched-chain amino acid transport system ATP-binding protein